ncbi:MAG TPA: isoamylase early set domain-containing protein [Syntrophorhabdales bacterium]|nr:isoamylase early set domain-containing protein [Syntrophorhabdales bacterium]
MAEKSNKAKTSAKTAGTKAAAKSAKAKAESKPTKAKTAAKPAKKKTAFKLHAPEATQVFVAGCFNDWDPTADPLTQIEGGTWMCTLMLEPGEHEYRFVVDGEWWDDPRALDRRANDFGCENCVIIV